MKNILVLGGTGAMGKHLVQILVDKGNKLSVTTRREQPEDGNIEYIQGNAKDSGFLQTLMIRHWDVIVDFMVYTTPVFAQRIPVMLAATNQYIFLSSARVYADSIEPIKEDSARLLDASKDSDFLATDEYCLAKARQENLLAQSSRNNWTVIRPYITYSEQRLQLGVLEKEEWLYRALKGRTIVFSKDIDSKLTTMTYGLDVAYAMASLIGEERAQGEVYHITQSRPVTWEKILDIYQAVLEKHLGTKPKLLLLDLNKFSRCKRKAEFQIKYDRLFDRSFDSTKIGNFVRVDSFVTLEDGLRRCIEEFLKSPEFLSIDWRSEATKDRFCSEVANLSEIVHWKQKLKYFIYRFIAP
tara:strand:- start:3028 stop:4092 length:1065 start_codon:yes stop_codon:yes gene_type:complete